MAKKSRKKPTHHLVKVICAWCKKPTGKQTVVRKMGGATTHGICIPCMKKHFPEQYARLRREKKLNPDTSFDDVLDTRQEAIEQTNEFVSKFEEYESILTAWTKTEILRKAGEQAMVMISAKAALNQGRFTAAETAYRGAKEDLENLTDKIGESQY